MRCAAEVTVSPIVGITKWTVLQPLKVCSATSMPNARTICALYKGARVFLDTAQKLTHPTRESCCAKGTFIGQNITVTNRLSLLAWPACEYRLVQLSRDIPRLS